MMSLRILGGVHLLLPGLVFSGVFACFTGTALAAHTHPEKYYQNLWCSEHRGEIEVVLPDKTRADCITNTHAIEFDFGPKWAESLGQALFYSLQTGKRAGIVLILKDINDRKYLLRLNSTIQHFNLPVDTWEMSE